MRTKSTIASLVIFWSFSLFCVRASADERVRMDPESEVKIERDFLVQTLDEMHNDVDRPFAKKGSPPTFLSQLEELFRLHPRNVIIWAHTGLGRIIQPVERLTASQRVLPDSDSAFQSRPRASRWCQPCCPHRARLPE